MSANALWLAEAIPERNAWALELEGGQGKVRVLLEQKGWRHVNADLRPGCNGTAVCADTHQLPFREDVFGLIVAKDALDHIENLLEGKKESG